MDQPSISIPAWAKREMFRLGDVLDLGFQGLVQLHRARFASKIDLPQETWGGYVNFMLGNIWKYGIVNGLYIYVCWICMDMLG